MIPRVLEAVAGLTDLDVLVIAGPANPRGEHAVPGVQVVRSVDDMAARMAWADLAIVAAGSTCWELACCGVPMIAIPVADNQLAVSEALSSLGVGVVLPQDGDVRGAVDQLIGDHARRAAMARRGRELVDGQGPLRVCRALRNDEVAR
jgi:UDP-2,4-diacetamido-2,4,6-trideoxy-beta-L-altropyranose hydrolase